MSESIHNNSHFDIVIVKNEYSLRNVRDFHEVLLDRLKKKESICLDFSQISKIDFSVIQVVASAISAFSNAEAALQIKNISKDVMATFEKIGFGKLKTISAA